MENTFETLIESRNRINDEMIALSASISQQMQELRTARDTENEKIETAVESFIKENLESIHSSSDMIKNIHPIIWNSGTGMIKAEKALNGAIPKDVCLSVLGGGWNITESENGGEHRIVLTNTVSVSPDATDEQLQKTADFLLSFFDAVDEAYSPATYGSLKVKIFEHTLSANAVYFLTRSDGEWRVGTKYGYEAFPSATEAMHHIRANLWY